ncbi:helix-turn-helix domain-containing protein [Chitinophaga ginsengisegetis]|uniref:helix-turn-helix domain-containing protein n=1 Tax=Chitinophaga ginsengisegetis TaxID=393003 RepID=UPI000DB9EA4D|nr:helix-turn-helix domain-containing protein [Chitinophaga ginsengisegetis]MDR6565493.1 transcriptional regulator with XRE-family HTH domain [Chitinophaga ginsengisegetis]MDR6645222.1 transcriptional regulator with XRE-family HTH domain [Chitinophaga ginsengisegetis]MDR6652187.1 transcriptional regulator with XRE-family HTH domain [Chitinophaga ginsengisegetis]
MSYLHEIIKRTRKERKVTQKEAAEFLGVSERMYQRYEKDIEPSIDQVKALDSLFKSNMLNQAPFNPSDEGNYEKAVLKALSFMVANLAAEVAILKGETPLSVAQYLGKIDESTNLILAGIKMSDENNG